MVLVFSFLNFSWPQISSNTTRYDFSDYSGSEETTDVSQELSPEKSGVTKSVPSNKSSAHTSTVLHCSGSGQHRGRSKRNGKLTLPSDLLVLLLPVNVWAALTSTKVNTHDVHLAVLMQDCVFPFPCPKKLNPVHLPKLDVAAFCFDFAFTETLRLLPLFQTQTHFAPFCSPLFTL